MRTVAEIEAEMQTVRDAIAADLAAQQSDVKTQDRALVIRMRVLHYELVAARGR